MTSRLGEGVARRLVMESRALEAVRALTAAGVDVRVVKGLALRAQLYEPDERRDYVDIDLLVPPAGWDRAREVLTGMGYAPAPSGGLLEHPVHSVAFRRSPATGSVTEIDLHHRFHGVRVSSRRFWQLAGDSPRRLTVGDAEVLTTPLPITGFHLLVSLLPEFGGGQRHLDEWMRFRARYPADLERVRQVAAALRATNTADRALALAAGESQGDGGREGQGDARPGPRPIPPKIGSIAASAWLAHLRRAPSVRARLTLIREVAANRRHRA